MSPLSTNEDSEKCHFVWPVYTYRLRHHLRHITFKVYHCVNGNGPSDGQKRYRSHSVCQTAHHHSHHVNLTVTEMETVRETVRVNRLVVSE